MDRIELTTKIRKIVEREFGGDWQRAFLSYSKGDDRVDGDELWRLLKDAGVGNVLTRASYVNKIMEVIDRDNDGRITWTEFEFVFAGGT